MFQHILRTLNALSPQHPFQNIYILYKILYGNPVNIILHVSIFYLPINTSLRSLTLSKLTLTCHMILLKHKLYYI